MRRARRRLPLQQFWEVPDVLAEKPDTVIIATGGLPEKDILHSGNELTVSPGTFSRAT
jgi:hypothetical protein